MPGARSSGPAIEARGETGVEESTAERDFNWLWGAHAVSISGSLITRAGLPFVAVLSLGATATQMAWLQSARLVSSGAAGLVVGPWVDARAKRPLLIGADIGRALVLACVPLAAAIGTLSFEWLVGVAVMAGMLDVLFEVARSAYLPALLGEQKLLRANTRLMSTSAVAEVPSFGLTGWLVQWLGGPRAIAIDALSFVLSALCIARIQTRERVAISRDQPAPEAPVAPPMAVTLSERATPARHAVARAARQALAEAAAGMRLIAHDPVQRALVVCEALLNFAIGVFMTTFTLYCTRTLGFRPGPLGMIFAAGGLSSLAGAALAPRLESRIGLGRAMTFGLMLSGVGMALLPIAHGANARSTTLLVLQQLIGDGGWTLFILAAGTTRMARAPAEVRGRMASAAQAVNMIATISGVVASGVLAERFGVRFAIVLGPLALFAGAALMSRSAAGRVREAAIPV